MQRPERLQRSKGNDCDAGTTAHWSWLLSYSRFPFAKGKPRRTKLLFSMGNDLMGQNLPAG